MSGRTLRLFEGYGLELELAVVDAETLDVRPIVDELLRRASGDEAWVEDVDDGPVGWSNELVLHVLELKTAGPVPSFEGVAADMQAGVERFDALLRDGWDARLLPGGMHPWMDPRTETSLWPHSYAEVYAAYDALFDCRRHGWANVQSVHLNLPFGDDEEFARLLAACRLVLPLVPALAAASPFEEGRAAGELDRRLVHYATNSARIPAMTGAVVPEAIFDVGRYRAEVLGAIDRQLAEHPGARALAGAEWSNARGVIARFDRMALEIRLLDAQESVPASVAVAAAVAAVVRGLVEERTASLGAQQSWSVERLRALLDATIARGPVASVEPEYATLLGLPGAATFAELWRGLAERDFDGPAELEAPLEVVLGHGTLAQRLLLAAGDAPDRARLRAVHERLADCLASGTSFHA